MSEKREHIRPDEAFFERLADMLSKQEEYARSAREQSPSGAAPAFWMKWPWYVQAVMWLGPPLMMALFFMAQNAGYIGSPIINNGEKLDKLKVSVDAEQALLASRTAKFDLIAGELLGLKISNGQQTYWLRLICVHGAKDKQGNPVQTEVDKCLTPSAITPEKFEDREFYLEGDELSQK